MIAYVKKTASKPAPDDNDQNRFESIRKAAAEQRRNADSDGTSRRARQTIEQASLVKPQA